MLIDMKPNFKYVADEDLKVQEGFPLAYKLIADKRILIDSNYLPVLELAEKGDSMAWFEMQEPLVRDGAGGRTGRRRRAAARSDRLAVQHARVREAL